MSRSKVLLPVLAAATAAVLIWLLFVVVPARYEAERTRAGLSNAGSPSATTASGRTIKAQLFYVGDDGTQLTSVERDVPFGENTADQAKAIVTAQIAPVVEPLVSAIPTGTVLRALFITAGGEAYVDLSRALVAAHPGGSTNELLTIRTLVDALTANLPAITAVQLLVEGKELDTLAGHVDLRRPFTRKLP